MTLNQFQNIASQFDQGLISIPNQRNTTAFLHNKKWYPARAFVEQVHQGITTQKAINFLHHLIPYLRIKNDVNFIGSHNFPIPLTIPETIEETKLALARLNELFIDNDR
jgi:hypothetical protein